MFKAYLYCLVLSLLTLQFCCIKQVLNKQQQKVKFHKVTLIVW